MRQLSILVFILFTACNDNNQATRQISVDTSHVISKTILTDTTNQPMNTWIDLLNNKKYSLPDSIEGKPVSFYINNSKVAAIAKSFFKGEFRPTDNDSTTELLSYVTTDDSTIRPFYRWCLDFTISISDGALGEYPGDPALKYAIKFPEEFFNYMDKDSSGNRYKEWTEIIAYSGLNEYNENQTLIEKTIKTRMRDNCHKCGEGTKNRIATFVKHLTETVKLQN